MKNREWLNTLTNEEFVDWVMSDYVSAYWYTEDNQIEWFRPPQSYSPTVAEIVSRTTDARIRLKEWLNEERKENGK